MLKQGEIRALKKQLNDRFLVLREEIRQELLQSDEQHFIDLAGQVHDLDEESVAELLVDLKLAVIDFPVEVVRSVDSAPMRIASGSYGSCSDCSPDIELARLQACPTATRCQPCQARHEREHAGHRHSTL